jgi:predicted enzyme related to lactoylglutathione lyase
MATIGGQVGIVYVRTSDAERTFAFYSQLFGWESEVHRDGFTAHYVNNTATLTVVSDDPDAVDLFFPVADVDQAIGVVEAAGGSVTDSAIGRDGGGWARVLDNQGVAFGLWRPDGLYEGAPPLRAPSGEVGYLTIDVPDPELARPFYRAVLGWETEARRPFLVDTDVPVDLHQVDGPPGVHLFFRVADLAGAADRVRVLGGEAGQPVVRGVAGPTAACLDDQGQALTLWEPARGF